MRRWIALLMVLPLNACGSSATPDFVGPSPTASTAATPQATKPAFVPPKHGNPNGKAVIPAGARAVDTSRPTRTIGDGTAASCTSAAVVAAVAKGGLITFSCGPDPITITMTATAKIRNATGPVIVLDGGGKVTLSGGGKRRILYMNTCDKAQGWTTSHCDDQDHPRLTVQNLTFRDGNSTGELTEGGGGGAIFVRGGQFTVVNSLFTRNKCDAAGPDLGGAALRVLDQHRDLPVHLVNSTFTEGVCANGGAISSIGVSWAVLNCVMRQNSAIGRGANPARPGTAGGGSGGAIYADGNLFTILVSGSIVESNKAHEGGSSIFMVSNDRTGTMRLENSVFRRNTGDSFHTPGFRTIFFLGARPPSLVGTKLS